MVPDNDLLLAQPLSFHRWAEIVFQKISLFLSGINTRLPSLRGHGFVLNSDAPDGNAFTLVGLNELREVVGPGLIKLWFQSATVKHIVVVLHEGRWTPGAAKDVELPSGRSQRLLYKRNPKLFVMVDAERVQLLVAFVYVGVAAAREITTMDVGSGQRVADAGAGIKIGL